MEEKVIDHLARVHQERERRMSQNPFAAMAATQKRHKEPAQIDNSTYIYDSNCMKRKNNEKKMHTYSSARATQPNA